MRCRAAGPMPRRFAAGIGTLEFAVVLAIVAALLYVLSMALAYAQEAMEKTSFEQQKAAIDAGLRYEAASRMARGQGVRVEDLAEENPIRWLAQRPAEYRGEFPGAPASLSESRGYWYYDTRARQLAYVPKRGAHLKFSQPRPMEIRMRVLTGDAARSLPGGIGLVAVAAYSWF